MSHFKALFCILAAAVLAACNSDPAPEAGAQAAPKPAAAKPAVAVNDPTSKMARAVGNGKPGAAVEIKYDILARPEAGKPVQVDIALIPGLGVDAMQATFSGMQGITLAGSLEANFPEVKSGEVYEHSLSLLPDHNGVFYITVAVTTQLGSASLGRTFSIPFVVGKSAVQEKPAAPAKDAAGQPVEPMQAEESGG